MLSGKKMVYPIGFLSPKSQLMPMFFTASGHMMKRHIKLRQVIQRLKDIKTTDTVSIRIQPTNGESTESGVTTRRINRKGSLDTVK